MPTGLIEQLASNPRTHVRRPGPPDIHGRCVIYWMQRAQRGRDNPALDTAVLAANALAKPIVVFFAPVPFYPHANLRHFQFLQEGIPDIARDLERRAIGFVLRPYPNHHLLKFCDEVRPALLIGDENPLREPEQWRQKVARELRIPFWTVDADVIVPSRLLGKEHYAARTIRPRLLAALPEFLTPLQNPRAHVAWNPARELQSAKAADDVVSGWKIDRSVSPVSSWRGGSQAAQTALRHFISRNLAHYPERRNHPELDGTSRLSPYLHFGHLGPHTVALAIQRAKAPQAAKAAFLEQLIVRRELAVNFVRFNPAYDSLECLEPWADRTLAEHASDRRPIIYTQEQLENAATHDALWNAAQVQMVTTGWMHNYLRMYWAKKILEWSPSPQAAYQRAVFLNDRYELDGRDPNGYAGIAWALVGKHDRPWFNRPIFGNVRYMSQAGISRKFDASKYIARFSPPQRDS
ncbi:MAG TPA: deoxyribodipyrimidine photo-lyase [Terriglobales bacterium]